MPEIKLAPNGKYEFWLDLGRDPVTGKRRQIHRSGFNKKSEAKEEIRRLQNEADAGVVVNKRQSSITLSEFAQVWIDYYVATSGVKTSTINERRKGITAINKHIGNVRLCDITLPMYNKFLTNLSQSYAPNTLSNIHAVGSMILDYAVECNLLSANPARKAKKPKKAETLDEVDDDIEEWYLSKSELIRLMDVVKDTGDMQRYALIRLLAYTGMRIGEALALEVSRVDFNASTIKIRRTYCNDTGRIQDYYLQTPKTKSSIRDIDVDDLTMELLRMWINEQRRNKMRQRDVWNCDHDFVFTSKRFPGYPAGRSAEYYNYKQYLKIAGLNPDYTFHVLRHTHASLLAESGASLEQIQQRLGHVNDEITKRIYLHITKDAKSNMIANFANYMSR